MPGCMLSATTASFSSVEKRRLRATPVITSTFENVSDIGTCLGLSLGPPAKAGVRSKRGAVQPQPSVPTTTNAPPMHWAPFTATLAACALGFVLYQLYPCWAACLA